MPMRPWALALLALGAFLLVAAASVIVLWDSIPGTFRRDEFGHPQGTGRVSYPYSSGAAQLVEDDRRGELVRGGWFRPDGASLQVTEWKSGTGDWLQLRGDGSVSCRMPMVEGVAHGGATYYGEDGSVL